jgi:hypothetical protein
VVAFGSSVLVMLLLIGGVIWYAGRRPAGTPLTWGQAMLAAVYSFFLMFWSYGVVPHQWLTWSQNEMHWTSARALYGPGAIFKPFKNGGHSPITLTYRVGSDSVAALIYIVLVGVQVGLWGMWQKRGKKPAAPVPVSEFGRPLVREGVS